MRSSGKSRNKNRNNGRRPNPGNVINRVFDSAGPEGKVRGTPQQIIEKYQSLAHDSQLSGDRVSAENFQQHSEHYARLLLEAQKEIAETLGTSQQVVAYHLKKLKEESKKKSPEDVFSAALLGGMAVGAGLGALAMLLEQITKK